MLTNILNVCNTLLTNQKELVTEVIKLRQEVSARQTPDILNKPLETSLLSKLPCHTKEDLDLLDDELKDDKKLSTMVCTKKCKTFTFILMEWTVKAYILISYTE